MSENLMECRDCKVEFDANDKFHKEEGFYNQCADCSEGTDDIKVKAFVEFDSEGCTTGIEVVSAERFNSVKELEELYSNASE